MQQYAADHRALLEAAGRHLGFSEPLAIELDDFAVPLLRAAKRGPLLPLHGVLVRDRDPDNRRTHPGVQIGMRLYQIEGICFARVSFHYTCDANCCGLDFTVVDRPDYPKLYRITVRCRRDHEPLSQPPVLAPGQLQVLWRNTIGYLENGNLDRIRQYGGRAKRGILLTGEPGNGKTMACRWIWEACRQRGWQYRLVTPDEYREARNEKTVAALFTVQRRGIVFFDDMDLALRDRDKAYESDDQAVFLSELDGITVHEGIVFVFTTNCSLDLIDRAFKRPGRLDIVLHFAPPDAARRLQLIERWHADIQAHLNLDAAVASTEGYSFAEIEELKNLLIIHHMDVGTWDWSWALSQFEINRSDLKGRRSGHLGFANGIGSRLNNGNDFAPTPTRWPGYQA